MIATSTPAICLRVVVIYTRPTNSSQAVTHYIKIREHCIKQAFASAKSLFIGASKVQLKQISEAEYYKQKGGKHAVLS